MRNFVMVVFIAVSILGIRAQVVYSESEIKQKNDSILREGNILFQYERAAWVATDMALARKEIKSRFGGYLIYQKDDTIKAIVLEKGVNECIYELAFKNDFNRPCKEIIGNRGLTEFENNLQLIKFKMQDAALKGTYNVTCPNGYSVNIELIPYSDGYKLYFILGTNQSDLIPFGNDYIFWGDKNGNITSWRKFHSRQIYTPAKYQGEKIRSAVHSHLQAEPFITATDICTFKLYGGLYGLNEFEVLSTSLKKYFKYYLNEDKIETRDY